MTKQIFIISKSDYGFVVITNSQDGKISTEYTKNELFECDIEGWEIIDFRDNINDIIDNWDSND